MRIYKSKDLTGLTIGSWSILKRCEQRFNGNYSWLCKCRCGILKKVNGNSLKAGRSLSCASCSKLSDLTNKKFNHLTAISFVNQTSDGFATWLFKCDCGNLKKIRGSAVVQGKTRSCGCKQGGRSELSNFEIMYKRIFRNYQDGAKIRKLSFCLTFDQVSNLIKQPCYYCSEVNSNKLKSKHKEKRQFIFGYNGIDRLDNNLGYVIENSVPCCKICNYMKQKLSVKEFLGHIEKIHEFSKGLL